MSHMSPPTISDTAAYIVQDLSTFQFESIKNLSAGTLLLILFTLWIGMAITTIFVFKTYLVKKARTLVKSAKAYSGPEYHEDNVYGEEEGEERDPVVIMETRRGYVVNKYVKSNIADALECKSPESVEMFNEYIVYLQVDGFDNVYKASSVDDELVHTVYKCRTQFDPNTDDRQHCDVDSLIARIATPQGCIQLTTHPEIYQQLDPEKKTLVNIHACVSGWRVRIVNNSRTHHAGYEGLHYMYDLMISLLTEEEEEEEKESRTEEETVGQEHPETEPFDMLTLIRSEERKTEEEEGESRAKTKEEKEKEK